MDKFLYVNHVLQYVNAHADEPIKLTSINEPDLQRTKCNIVYYKIRDTGICIEEVN